MNPNQATPQVPQKLTDFNTDLKALCDKYQYELRAVMEMLPSGAGIVAVLKVFDTSPKVDGVDLKPQTEQTPPVTPPAETPPANPENVN